MNKEGELTIQQIAFEVPLAINSKLLTGEYIQWGGVVRDQTGKIVTHLKPVQIEQAGEQAVSVAKAVRGFAQNNRNAIIVVGVAVTAAAIAGGAAIYQHLKKDRQKAVAFSDLNEALAKYMSAIAEGALNEEVLDQAVAAIDAAIDNLGGDGMKIEIEGKTFASLVNIVHDYTERLHDSNSSALDSKVIEMPNVGDNTLESLRDHLKAQRLMFDLAA